MSNRDAAAEIDYLCEDLLRRLDKSGCPESINPGELKKGTTEEFMNVIRFILCSFSKYVHNSLCEKGFSFSTTHIITFMRTSNDAIQSEFGVYGEVAFSTAKFESLGKDLTLLPNRAA